MMWTEEILFRVENRIVIDKFNIRNLDYGNRMWIHKFGYSHTEY